MNGTVNKVTLIGNLGDDVKLHRFDDANCIGRFPVATSESYTAKETNERVTQTEWHNVVVRNKLAEICDKYLSKGDKVYIEGKLKTRKWNDNGQDRYTTEVVANQVEFLNTKKEGETPSKSTKNEQHQQPPSPSAEDDLPF